MGSEPWRDSDLHHADVFTEEEEERERMGKSARGPKRFHMHPGRTTRNETQALPDKLLWLMIKQKGYCVFPQSFKIINH